MESQENYESGEVETGVLRMSLRERPRKEIKNKRSYIDDFEPEHSEKENQKRKSKRLTGGSKYSLYDEYGHLRHNGADVCDCMNNDCPGCWYECEKCGSTKCGAACRVNRKFYYESMAFDGKDMTIVNPNLTQK